jgi:hypothetical protein
VQDAALLTQGRWVTCARLPVLIVAVGGFAACLRAGISLPRSDAVAPEPDTAARADLGPLSPPATFAADRIFPTINALSGLCGGQGLALGWGDFSGTSAGSDPDRPFDLVVASPGVPSEIYSRTGPGFVDDDYRATGLLGSAATPRISVSVGPFLADGRVEAVALAGITTAPWPTQVPELVYQWSPDVGGYIDLAQDDIVVDDNELLQGSTHTPADSFQSTYDYNMVFFDYDNDGDPDIYRLHGGNTPFVESMPSRVLTNLGQVGGLWRYGEIGAGDAAAAHPYSEGRGVAIADVDFDGRSDVLVASRNAQLFLNRTVSPDTPSFVAFDDVGAGLSSRAASGSLTHGVTTADLDNDADQDLIWIPYGRESWQLLHPPRRMASARHRSKPLSWARQRGSPS